MNFLMNPPMIDLAISQTLPEPRLPSLTPGIPVRRIGYDAPLIWFADNSGRPCDGGGFTATAIVNGQKITT